MTVVPWLFLAVSIWGALFTLNALYPVHRPWQTIGVSFFPAWLTTELALHHILWQAVATAIFIGLGALDAVVGWIGLGITLLSWLGLVRLFVAGRRSGEQVEAALEAALGDGFRDRIAHEGQPMPARLEWRRIVLPFLVSDRHVERVRDLAYVDDGDRRHRLDLYRRRDAAPGAPVLLQIHGGGWMIGEKRQQGLPLMYHLAARGWLCVAINYRLSPRATWPDHLVDCKRALAWIREHAAEHGGDPGFVVVTGGSAGGHLAAMMGLTANDPEYQPGFESVDTRVDAFVPFYGVFDWTDRFGVRGPRDPLRRALERYIVKQPRDEAPEVFDRASPLSRLDGDIPPAMVLHGTRDTLAPVAEARRFVEALRAASSEPVVYVELDGAHHAFELFPSVRALHSVNGVADFVAWVATRRAASDGGHREGGAASGPTPTARTGP